MYDSPTKRPELNETKGFSDCVYCTGTLCGSCKALSLTNYFFAPEGEFEKLEHDNLFRYSKNCVHNMLRGTV